MFQDISVNDKKEFGVELFDYRKYRAKVVQHWWWFLLSIPLCLGLGYFFHRSTLPVYQIGAKVIIQDLQGSAAGDNLLLRQIGFEQGGKTLEKEIFQLRSELLMKDVVRELGLNVRYFQMGRLRDSEYYRNAPVRLSLDNPEYAVPFSILVRCDGKGGFKAFTRDDQEIYGGKSGDMFAVGEEPVTIEILNPE